jgi:uncharacterized membrane protein
MQEDTKRKKIQGPGDDSGGYASSPQLQQSSGTSNVGQDAWGGGYRQYYQQYPQSLQEQQQQQYWRQQPYGVTPCCDVGPYELTSIGIRARTAGWLSYLFGWVTGLIFFLLEKENRFVRFHAMQSMLFFGGISILEGIIRFFEMQSNYTIMHLYGVGLFSSVLGLVSLIMWIVLMVRASKGIYYKLPFIGDFADKLIDQIHV